MDSSAGSSSSSKKPKMFGFLNSQSTKISDFRDWSALPWNLISDIADKLPVIEDFVRFGAVCVSWHTIFIEKKKNAYLRRAPFLFVENRALYSPCNKKEYDLCMQLPLNQVCCGSSFGWLVMLVDKGRNEFHLQLQNPVLKKAINLPSLDNIFNRNFALFRKIVTRPGGFRSIARQPDHPLLPLFEQSVREYVERNFQQPTPPRLPFESVRKVAVSCDPSSSMDFIAVGIVGEFYSLAFFKPGNYAWVPIGEINPEQEIRGFTDVIYFQKTKQFYATFSSGEVFAINFTGEASALVPTLTQVAPPNTGFKYMLLVEDLASGDLYQVNNDIITCMDWCRIPPFSKFNVFKLNTAEGKWTKVDNLGSNVLFFGYNCSMIRSASNCPGCEPNHIYFITYMESRMDRKYYEPPYAGIYNLEDGSIRPLSTQTLHSTVWIEPTLV